MNYRITAKRKKSASPIVDYRTEEVLWDGKPKLLTLTYGDEFVIKYMFSSMKKYVDEKIWTIKLEKQK